MRIEEARWIRDQLAKLPDISPVVELGSSTLEFRTRNQPHIDRLIHAPMRERSVRVIHADYKQENGVDIAGDIFDSAIQQQIKAAGPRTVLCCNMFEHVTDRKGLAEFCAQVVPLGGYLVLTGPHSYPIHHDPIDTYFRPTPEEMSELFPDFEVVAADVVESDTYAQEMLENPRQLPRAVARHLYRLAKIWGGRDAYKANNHRLLWLFRRYKIYCLVLRKTRR